MNPIKDINRGSLSVSRIAWEVVQVSDSCIREDVESQVEKLVAILAKLRHSKSQWPVALREVHRLLQASQRNLFSLKDLKTEERFRPYHRYCSLRYYEDALNLLQGELRPVASFWHSSRRAQILKSHPEICVLLRDDPMTYFAMFSIIVAHLYIALQLQRFSGLGGCLFASSAAALFGGFCAFGFQALDHELSHHTSQRNLSLGLGLLGSGCTLVPWFSYYFSGGHERHHRFAGTPRDIDREAFFWAWEKTPPFLDSNMGSLVWASLVGMGLPVLYVVSLGGCLLGNWRANLKELGYFAADSVVTICVHVIVFWFGGLLGLWYLILSMAFANGFLAHPLIGFWLMQHICHASVNEGDRQNIILQPTVSYCGSRLWNLLNFNQLSHVEHHDFSRLPWTRAPLLKSIAPEFYGAPLHEIRSVRGLIWRWITTRGDKLNFACILAAAPPLDSDPPVISPSA